MNSYLKFLFALVVLSVISSCDGFLDEKPSKSLVVPSSLNDIQAILDTESLLNQESAVLFLQSDDFELLDPAMVEASQWQRDAMFWNGDIENPSGVTLEYAYYYQKIFYSNLVLELLEKEVGENREKEKDLKGQALFYRAFGYWTLAQLYMPAYHKGKDLQEGILPYRMSSQIDLKVPLATVSQIYKTIVEDLEESISLLPDKATYVTRPSLAAASGLLSRIKLSMGDYQGALDDAESALQISSDLMDYNLLDLESYYPISLFNPEVIFHGELSSHSFIYSNSIVAHKEIYDSYDSLDLRKQVYFIENTEGLPNFRGSYTGSYEFFSGISVDELLLTAAECSARLGDVSGGMAYLNQLLVTRWVHGTYVPVETENAKVALDLIVMERRKSLPFRGVRWMDLQRLSQEPNYNKVLIRESGGTSGSLDLSQASYALKIPTREVNLE
ncbi:RagB/SusD family nutrient uptake outer membrane protein [Algoriphagus sp. NG3]|uniref:RagB/SusD family nutrient uptake outer membrane protein n=1 Tax=Algoriphagus sp. NG3 TaxID=3097546 RepID=UPI002A80CE3D|nr:RagB/SusD family nutrient uptake outer membrane protein [Algoriphagus sp. NG3]WPR75231.1 RagB/SusD family nutrient uptake outer membrane protein [Algoriphagus sp. NG3]